jgi:hypothetical protein
MGRGAADAVGMEDAPVTLEESVAGLSKSVRLPRNFSNANTAANKKQCRLTRLLVRKMGVFFSHSKARLMLGRKGDYIQPHGEARDEAFRSWSLKSS